MGETIRCRLCGGRYRLITPSHLRHRHGWAGAHPGLDYRRRFGVRSVWSGGSLRAMSRSLLHHFDRRGRRWNRDSVLRALGRSRSLRFTSISLPLYWAAQRLFGTWEAALRAAGLTRPAWPRWTRASVLAALRLLRVRRWSAAPRPLYWAAQRLFGSWRAAVSAAGKASPPGAPARALR